MIYGIYVFIIKEIYAPQAMLATHSCPKAVMSHAIQRYTEKKI